MATMSWILFGLCVFLWVLSEVRSNAQKKRIELLVSSNKDLRAELAKKENMVFMNAGFLINGPRGCVTVYKRQRIEKVIDKLAQQFGYDADDFTVSQLCIIGHKWTTGLPTRGEQVVYQGPYFTYTERNEEHDYRNDPDGNPAQADTDHGGGVQLHDQDARAQVPQGNLSLQTGNGDRRLAGEDQSAENRVGHQTLH